MKSLLKVQNTREWDGGGLQANGGGALQGVPYIFFFPQKLKWRTYPPLYN